MTFRPATTSARPFAIRSPATRLIRSLGRDRSVASMAMPLDAIARSTWRLNWAMVDRELSAKSTRRRLHHPELLNFHQHGQLFTGRWHP